jgi:hypothetical protein
VASIKFAQPWVKKLASPESPLVDGRKIEHQVARMKAIAEMEDGLANDLFRSPMQPKPDKQPALTFPELEVDERPLPEQPAPAQMPPEPLPAPPPAPEPMMAPPPLPPLPEPPLTPPVPDVPPPLPPVDRPPGAFVIDR